MNYIKADLILPTTLIEELQRYIQGGENKKGWGELSGYKHEIDERSRKIQMEYTKGKSIEDLAEQYFLSVHSIRKIIYK